LEEEGILFSESKAYVYEHSFDIPGITSVSGPWATDNYGEIFLNGTSTGFTKDLSGFTSFENFNITSGFKESDTLLFRVLNHSDRTGLLVTDLTAEVVPVPSSAILGGLGLTFSGCMLKRKKMT